MQCCDIFSYLLMNPKDTRVIIVESLLTPNALKNSLAEVLFQHLNVWSIIWSVRTGIYAKPPAGLPCHLHAKPPPLHIYHRMSVNAGSGYRLRGDGNLTCIL